jgi:hypothetical protein
MNEQYRNIIGEMIGIAKIMIDLQKNGENLFKSITPVNKKDISYIIDISVFNLLFLQTRIAKLKEDIEEIPHLSCNVLNSFLEKYERSQEKISRQLKNYYYYQSLGFTNAPEG